MYKWISSWFRRLRGILGRPRRNDPWAEATGLNDHFRAISDPLRDYKVLLIGDSKTWGLYASGIANFRPRWGSFLDARNNFTSPTWANLFSQHVGRMFMGSETPGEAVRNRPGVVQWSKIVEINPLDDSRVHLYSKSGKLVGKKAGSVRGSVYDQTLKIRSGEYIEFLTESYNLDLIYTAAPNDKDACFSVTFSGSKPVITNFYSPAFEAGHALSLKWGPTRRKIIVKNLSKRTLHLEAIRRRKYVRISNHGIIGTAARSWIPEGKLLKKAVRRDDTHAIVALGTNGKLNSTIETNKKFMRSIIAYLRQCGISPLVVADSEVRADRGFPNLSGAHFGLVHVRQMVQELAKEETLDWLDWYSATKKHLDSGLNLHAKDGIHENDLGHRIKFEVLWEALGGTTAKAGSSQT